MQFSIVFQIYFIPSSSSILLILESSFSFFIWEIDLLYFFDILSICAAELNGNGTLEPSFLSFPSASSSAVNTKPPPME